MIGSEIIFGEDIKKSFWHWKRVVHTTITLMMILFLIWYMFPDNRVMRNVDVCIYYGWKTNQTCECYNNVITQQNILPKFNETHESG